MSRRTEMDTVSAQLILRIVAAHGVEIGPHRTMQVEDRQCWLAQRHQPLAVSFEGRNRSRQTAPSNCISPRPRAWPPRDTGCASKTEGVSSVRLCWWPARARSTSAFPADIFEPGWIERIINPVVHAVASKDDVRVNFANRPVKPLMNIRPRIGMIRLRQTGHRLLGKPRLINSNLRSGNRVNR